MTLDKDSILKSIELSGAALPENACRKIIIAGITERANILTYSHGLPVINRTFKLIISQPEPLRVLTSFEIRCCMCSKVISYPCWYHTMKYAVNHFHYFVCFDSSSSLKVSTKCYRRIN